MNCIHNETGLCPDCQADHDADPTAWLEFGLHTQGVENSNRLQAEMEAARPELEQEANSLELHDLPL